MIEDIKKDIIIGIDPGTTKGYAILDLEGNLMDLKSGKVSITNIIDEVVRIGNPIIISTDVLPVPKIVRKLSTLTNSKIISPEKSLDSKRKRKLTSDYSRVLIKENLDKHKLDALAAAYFAYKKIRNKLDKIDIVLEEENKKHLLNDVRRKVLNDGINIKRALESFLK